MRALYRYVNLRGFGKCLTNSRPRRIPYPYEPMFNTNGTIESSVVRPNRHRFNIFFKCIFFLLSVLYADFSGNTNIAFYNMKKQNKKVRMKSSVSNDKKSLKSFHKTRTILILFFILNMEAKGREKIAASHSRNKKFLFFILFVILYM